MAETMANPETMAITATMATPSTMAVMTTIMVDGEANSSEGEEKENGAIMDMANNKCGEVLLKCKCDTIMSV
ncbi:hypothetical protein DPMN_045680 [Dreissena polymorpha]|uniref:Uncharacterized protein n=1 Tax=Dreissena polymorpha TaxID=45954 RepID=A0A9D4D5G7_DREPO|nr:hypothetical protein DPMN_045680 [Dreissena polymorpha]